MTGSEITSRGLFKKALKLHEGGQYKKAVKMYNRALEAYGFDKKTLVLRGNSYYLLKDYKKAEESYKEALGLDPNYSKAYFNLGIIYDEKKRFKEALSVYKRAIDLDEGFVDAHANLGDVYKTLGDLENAVLHYDKALSMEKGLERAVLGLKDIPKSVVEKVRDRELLKAADILMREGIAFERKGDKASAMKRFEEAYSVYPKSAAAFFISKLGQNIEDGNQIKIKEVRFQGVDPAVLAGGISTGVREFLGTRLGGIELEPKILEGFLRRFQEALNRVEDEEFDLPRVVRQTLFEEPHKMLVKAHDKEMDDDPQKASEIYLTVAEMSPYLLHAKFLYGLLLETMDEEETAFEKYKDALNGSFDYLYPELERDVTTLFAGKPGFEYLRELDVIATLKEFLKSYRESGPISLLRFLRYKLSMEAEAKIKYGFEREESGDSLEAINAYEDATSIDPNNPITHYVLGLAYESRGLEEEAMAEYEKTKGADYRGVESSEEISQVMEEYLSMTTKDGHRVGTILGRYFEIIAKDPEHMLELLGFIEDLKIESISKILKSYIATDLILGSESKVVRDQQDFGAGGAAVGKDGRVIRDRLDFGEDLDKEKEKVLKSRSMSKVDFELLWKYKTSRSIRSEAVSEGGKEILAGSENGIIYLIDQKANSPWRYDAGGSIVDIDISPEGRYGIYCDSNNRVELLSCPEEGKSLWRVDMGKTTRVNSVAIASEGRVIAASTNMEIIFFNLDGSRRKTMKMEVPIKMLDITDDGSILVAASDNDIYLIEDEKPLRKPKSFISKELIQSIAISKDGRLLSVGTREGSVFLIDIEGRVLWRKNIRNPIYGVSVSLNGRVATGGMNGTIILFSKEGEQLWKYQTGENIWDVDISKSGGKIVSGCGLVFGNVYLFELKEGDH